MYRTSLLQPRDILSHLRPFGKCFLQKITIFLFYFLCFVNSRIFCARCTIPALFAGGKLPRFPFQHQYGRERRGLYLYYKGTPSVKACRLCQLPLGGSQPSQSAPVGRATSSPSQSPTVTALPKGEPLAWRESSRIKCKAACPGSTPSVCSLRSQPPSPRGRLNPLSPLPLVASSSPEGGAFCHLPVNAARAPPFGGAGIAQR